ncbi:MAG: [acyl-carrier-protein] S-malonyltransferase [Acidobacteria bacterium]|nr:MAG: [acyl-carrier-protein] S-malonyltransferase [Acidobacteriota bacterium]
MSLICLFPGQGSQAKGMGAELFDRYGDWTADADRVLGYSIRELCLDDPRGELGLTEFTQPALFVVNAMTYRAKRDAGMATPAFLAGHSLGEYNALLAAGCFDFATGLTLVKERGRMMGRVTGGGMAAVVGLEPDRVRAVLASTDAGRLVDAANFNTFDQTVIAGPKDALESVKPSFEAAGVRAYIPLNVSAPFHSRYMREPQNQFGAFLKDFAFSAPSIEVVANVNGRPYQHDMVRQTLAEQIGNSVQWLETMLYLMRQPEPEFIECGPGTVLTKMLAQIRKRIRTAG